MQTTEGLGANGLWRRGRVVRLAAARDVTQLEERLRDAITQWVDRAGRGEHSPVEVERVAGGHYRLAEGQSVRDNGPGDGAHGRRHLLAPEADLPEAVYLPAVEFGAVGPVDRRVRWAVRMLAAFFLFQDRPTFFQNIPI